MDLLRRFLVVVTGVMMTSPTVSCGPKECCSAGDVQHVQSSWQRIWGSAHTERRVLIAKTLFDDLFQFYPDARALFRRVGIADPDSPEYKSHLLRIAGGIDSLVHLLSSPNIIPEQLAHLGEQHAVRPGLKKVYFEELVLSFGRVLPQVDSCVQPQSWINCFEKLMIVVSSYIENVENKQP